MEEETRKAMEKIEKLMRLSASNPNPEEASSALAKAQELLAAYNLDMTTIEQNSGVSGKRLDEMVSGGMYSHQRQLWRNIAELNFCCYWTMKVRTKEGSVQRRRHRAYTHEHRLVGRQINVVATKNMAAYLNSVVVRLCKEKLGTAHYNSDTIAFREGIVDRVVDKIQERRQTQIDKEERSEAEAARRASRSGVSDARSLTVAKLSETEEQGNYDFLHGEGAWARKKAEEIEYERRWAERRERQAKAQADAEKEHAEWATSHPEEAAAEEKRRLAEDRKEQKKWDRRRPRYRFRETKEEQRKGSSAYHSGWDAGKDISIDPQVDEDKRRISRG